MTNKAWLGAVALTLVAIGCGKDEEPTTCADDMKIGGDCIGVPLEPLCGEEQTCTTGSCAQTTVVANQSELDQAVSGASPGSCIALLPGDYASVTLPEGVSLFGRHPDDVRIAGVVASGSKVTLRGLGVGMHGIRVTSGDVTLDSVRIDNAENNGVEVGQAAYVTVQKSEIQGSGRYGVAAFAAAGVSLSYSRITAGGGPGMWASCTVDGAEGCSCSAAVRVALSSVKIDKNVLVGLALNGSEASLTNVVVADSDVSSFEHGGGVAAFGCSDVNATGLVLESNASYGMLVHDSTAYVDGIEARGNLRGVWVQELGASMAGGVTLRNGIIESNDAVGVGIGDNSLDVVLENLEVRDTKLLPIPVVTNGVSAGAADVGDGITWKSGAQVTLRSLALSGNDRVSVLIDGDVGPGSVIEKVALSGGDEVTGIQQQNATVAPELIDAPAITTPAVPHKVAQNMIPPGI